MRTILRLAGALAVLLVASPALAQYIAPMRYNEGPGFKLTDSLVFHPGLAIEGRFDSNALYTEKNATAAGYLRFLGHIDLSTTSPQRLTDGDGKVAPRNVEFRLKTAVGFREYLSGNAAVKAQRAVELDAGLLLALFPQGVFSASLNDDFARTVQSRYAETADTLARDTNRVALTFKLAPGGGLLTFGLGYALGLDLFEDKSMAGANKLFHEINFTAKWRLLPKTAIQLEVIEQIISYYDKAGGVFGTAAAYQNVDAKPFRAYFGLSGLLTSMLSVVAKLGYGNSITSGTGPSFNSILAVAEMGLQIGPYAKVKLGYQHLFQDSMFANYFTDEQIYLGYDHLILNRIVLFARGDYRYRTYSGLHVPAADQVAIKQHVVTLGVGGDYQIKEWIYVGVGYDLQLLSRITGPTSATAFAPSYAKHQIYGKVGVSY